MDGFRLNQEGFEYTDMEWCKRFREFRGQVTFENCGKTVGFGLWYMGLHRGITWTDKRE